MQVPKDAREVYLGEDGTPIAYCPKDNIGLTDILRGNAYQDNADRLHQLANRAVEKEKEESSRQAVICIDVDDPAWTAVVDMLMPGHDWDAYRAKGQKPYARGVVPHNLCTDLVKAYYPAAGEAVDGVISIFVLAAGGIMIVTSVDR
jgi:hypothetical protein